MIKYYPEKHSYINDKGESLVSVTTLINHFKQPFDSRDIALKVSQKKTSKFYNMSVDEIENIWREEGERGIKLGNYYHQQREKEIVMFNKISMHGKELPVVLPILEDGVKLAPCQVLQDGIYVEHLVHLETTGLVGIIDRGDVVDTDVHITDYKTNKDIAMESYKNWQGISKKMLHPLSHLDDCKFNHIQLQLSLYMYMIIKHNPQLYPKSLKIQHAIFEEEAKKDKYGYPLTKYDINGNPILKEVKIIECKYLLKEVINIIDYYSRNKHLFKHD